MTLELHLFSIAVSTLLCPSFPSTHRLQPLNPFGSFHPLTLHLSPSLFSQANFLSALKECAATPCDISSTCKDTFDDSMVAGGTFTCTCKSIGFVLPGGNPSKTYSSGQKGEVCYGMWFISLEIQEVSNDEEKIRDKSYVLLPLQKKLFWTDAVFFFVFFSDSHATNTYLDRDECSPNRCPTLSSCQDSKDLPGVILPNKFRCTCDVNAFYPDLTSFKDYTFGVATLQSCGMSLALSSNTLQIFFDRILHRLLHNSFEKKIDLILGTHPLSFPSDFFESHSVIFRSWWMCQQSLRRRGHVSRFFGLRHNR